MVTRKNDISEMFSFTRPQSRAVRSRNIIANETRSNILGTFLRFT